MSNQKILYNVKLATICGMLIGTPALATNQKQSIWDKINSTPMSEKIAIAQNNYNRAHLGNVCFSRSSAIKYIEKNITDVSLANFMIRCIITDGYDYYNDLTIIIIPRSKEMISDIKSNYKWFDDLMKYLSGKYSDEEFYRTGFFSKIGQPAFYFSATLYDISRWRGFIERNSNSK